MRISVAKGYINIVGMNRRKKALCKVRKKDNQGHLFLALSSTWYNTSLKHGSNLRLASHVAVFLELGLYCADGLETRH